MHVSPLTLKMMLACYCSSEPEREVGVSWRSPAGAQVRGWLSENGLIDEDLRATDKGWAWVQHICATPLPERVWVKGGEATATVQRPLYGAERFCDAQIDEAVQTATARD